MGSPGKVWHDRTLEVVGSTPIGSTNPFKGLDAVRPLETLPELPIVRMFSLPGGHRGDRRRFLFLLCQISLLVLGGCVEVFASSLARASASNFHQEPGYACRYALLLQSRCARLRLFFPHKRQKPWKPRCWVPHGSWHNRVSAA